MGTATAGPRSWRRNTAKSAASPPDYINVIVMVDNWLPGFDMEEQKQIDKGVEKNLAVILEDLRSRKRFVSPVTETDRAAHPGKESGGALPQ